MSIGIMADVPLAVAREVSLRDFILISVGMSEAEVLYRLGPFDYETVYTDHYRYPIRKRWAYLPVYGKRGWITEITFDSRGRVQNIERYKP
jgi:hypothetical protein